MVSQKFINNLTVLIKKQLKEIINGSIKIRAVGTPADQEPSRLEFGNIRYTPQEFLFARIPVIGPYITYIDFATPILNFRGKSVQGIASFVTTIPHPIAETYVERGVGLSTKLLPHKLVVEQGIKPKKVIKNKMITSQAINSINNDTRLRVKFLPSSSCKIDSDFFGTDSFKINLDTFEYPPGMFTIVPYYGYSILITKEAGKWGAEVNKPNYGFKERYDAFYGVAKYISSYPEEGELEGKLYMDSTLNIILPRLLKYIRNKS